MDFNDLLRLVYDQGASDLFITAGVPPCIKVDGKLKPIHREPMKSAAASALVYSIMDDEQKMEFRRGREMNFAISAPELGRFRVSAFYQRGHPGMVLRRIETVIPTLAELHLPDVLEELAMAKRGLVLFVGATGTGKSTSLAALVGHRNLNSQGHIITVEDPIEFVHPHRGCIVTQREVGVDTESYEVALKNTLRQAPDVILIGEIRTRETMEHAITFAETGHLVLATLHANNANQALDRILHFFPAERHGQLWMDLALNLKAMVAQQLIPLAKSEGRRIAVEVLLNTPLVADLIRKGEVHTLKEVMGRSQEQGMQTFDQALLELYLGGLIAYEEALRHADSKNDLRLMIKLRAETDADFLASVADEFSLEEDAAHTPRTWGG